MLFPDKIPAPSWVDLGAVPVKGLDLTGLRLPVQAIGTRLLDGVTTITPSVRYFSFFCWVVHNYVQARLPNSWTGLRAFAEEVESAIALGNVIVDPSVSGVIGSQGALKRVQEGGEPLPLSALVKQPAISTYANPSRELGFTLNGSEVPGLSSERGAPLAREVHRLLATTRLGAVFSSGCQVGEAHLADLREFGEIFFIPRPSEQEIPFLLAAILPETPRSKQEAQRVASYTCLLGLAQKLCRVPEEKDLFKEAQSARPELPSVLQPILDGWLRYSVRDVLAVCHERVLEEIVHALNTRASDVKSIPASEILGSFVADRAALRNVLAALDLIKPNQNPCEMLFGTLFDRIADMTRLERVSSGGLFRWTGKLSEELLINTALDRTVGPGALALLPVAWCVAFIRAEEWPKHEGKHFEERCDLGWSRFGVHEVIIPAITKFRSEKWTIAQVILELACRTVEQHLRISWSRMAVDTTRDVALLISEGERWQARVDEKHVREYNAGRTASRLAQAISWLQQLRLIDDAGLTTEGRRIFDRCLRVLHSGSNS